ncbi:protein JTB-like [Centruroides sculpturatus]|uniref:protein JTB-like n=1 Tax=Centruroides sculpturatus TaxID=218467 RepID=UPI000C6EF4B1|nr:protein JTB-like [Centruroides sculpturatus]
MIESCSFRRMVFVVASLVCSCLVVLVVESVLAPSPDKYARPTDELDNSSCWNNEKYSVTQNCRACNQFEKVSKHTLACLSTGYKEEITCEKSGTVYRSCKVPWLEQRNFWLVEGTAAGMALLGGLAVTWRQKRLDRRTVERIQRQIAAGV